MFEQFIISKMTVYDGRKGSRPINFIVTQIVITWQQLM